MNTGEGDVFIGVSVPNVRLVAREFCDLPFAGLTRLIKSAVHEERLLALRILADRYESSPELVFAFYIRNLKYVNNWDLVDTSAPEISEPYAFYNAGALRSLFKLASGSRLWDRRVAMMLLRDEHDLMHRAVGWMLREVGKRDRSALDGFLAAHVRVMPRTALRYAIEKHALRERKRWMAG